MSIYIYVIRIILIPGNHGYYGRGKIILSLKKKIKITRRPLPKICMNCTTYV